MDKTIHKLKLQNGTFLTAHKEILHEVKTFYEKLFSNKDTGNLNDEITLDSLIDNKKFNCLKKSEASELDGEITLKELNETLSKMKNNKTPGLDGFPADFYKVFWVKLRIFILHALNESYKTASLQLTMRQLVITCIPKRDISPDIT